MQEKMTEASAVWEGLHLRNSFIKYISNSSVYEMLNDEV